MFFWFLIWHCCTRFALMLRACRRPPLPPLYPIRHADCPRAELRCYCMQNGQQAVEIRSLREMTVAKLTLDLLILKRRLFGRSAESSEELMIQGQLFPAATVEIDLPPGKTSAIVQDAFAAESAFRTQGSNASARQFAAARTDADAGGRGGCRQQTASPICADRRGADGTPGLYRRRVSTST